MSECNLVDEGRLLVCQARAEIERLQELLRGVGANRYWEGRWRDAEAEIERLTRWNRVLQRRLQDRADEVSYLQADNDWLRRLIHDAIAAQDYNEARRALARKG